MRRAALVAARFDGYKRETATGPPRAATILIRHFRPQFVLNSTTSM